MLLDVEGWRAARGDQWTSAAIRRTVCGRLETCCLTMGEPFLSLRAGAGTRRWRPSGAERGAANPPFNGRASSNRSIDAPPSYREGPPSSAWPARFNPKQSSGSDRTANGSTAIDGPRILECRDRGRTFHVIQDYRTSCILNSCQTWRTVTHASNSNCTQSRGDSEAALK